MKIAGYVGDLLYDYECVVIPGLGGFITKDKSAQVVAVTHHFKPPFREVLFNVHLKTNDGLLINYVARQEELSYREAKSRVDLFVYQCRLALDSGKRIRFHGIGSLANDENKNTVFTQDKSINYNPQAFGLGSFVSPAIVRTTNEEKVLGAIKKVVPEKKPVETASKVVRPKKILIANRKKSTFEKQLIFLMVVFFLMGVGYVYNHRHSMGYYAERYSHTIPLLYTGPHTFLATNINLIPYGKMSYYAPIYFPGLFNKENPSPTSVNPSLEYNQATLIPLSSNTVQIDKESIEEPITEVIVETVQPVITEKVEIKPEVIPEKTITTKPVAKNVSSKPKPEAVATPAANSFRYFIIAGSFNNEHNALNLVNELKSKGFSAMIADTNKYGMFRVAYTGFQNEEEATLALVSIKNQQNHEAWLLKK